ncbi:MAG TPA: stimulus-sensing domain-containing protein [Rhizomicrobium sp.]|jgi:two-component system sensor histidine kinase ChvG|nr:stimulus-sensing domain-containing protein [Rhizomicrobium sp.]
MTMPDHPRRRARYSALTRRILFVNGLVLLVLIAGVILVQWSRVGLVDERLTGIETQAQIVASTLAEYATDPDDHRLVLKQAEPLLRQLIAPTKLRGRLYLTDGTLAIDTRDLLARNVVQTGELPAIDTWSQIREFWNRIYDGVTGVRPFTKLDPYFEAGDNGRVYREVNTALSGDMSSAQRVNDQNKLVLSVAAPVQRFKAVYGALLVSTEGGDIDDVLREERATLLEVFVVAMGVMLASSLLLSRFIARPVLALADAADRVRSGRAGRETIPSMEERNDEIGDLASSFSAMTRALYDRIDAIESFAADVAHEIKNPLTSLKSAVEMLTRAKDDASRERMMGIVKNDVKRIDRLITDISDASRLDAELSRETSDPVDIKHLLETIVEVYNFTDLSQRVPMALDIDLPKEATVIGRDERLGQVIRNLIDNAVSFSPDGRAILISARAEGGFARIVVEDCGPGIPPDNLETIFDRFYTERPHEHGFGKNSGLGLSIARQIVDSTGGRIWAENREEGGARFIVLLPLVRSP